MRRISVAASFAVLTAGVLGFSASPASAAFNQCPPVGVDTGCQFLIVVSDQGSSVLVDGSQPPYETVADSLIGVQNNSSRPLASLGLASPAGQLAFAFDGDGLCNNAHGPAPAGCQPPPGSTATCNPSTSNSNQCSFPPPPGEPPNYTEPGATDFAEETMPPATVQAPWPNGDLQNGYEGPQVWFSNVSADRSAGIVNFSSPLAPGQSTYFSLEAPLGSVASIGFGSTSGTPPVVQNPSVARTTISTVLSGDGISGSSITVPQGTAVRDVAIIHGPSAASANGTVNYAIYRDKGCKVMLGSETQSVVNGKAAPSSPIQRKAGTYYLRATYNGDAVNAPSASACRAEVLVDAVAVNFGLPSTHVCVGHRRLLLHLHKPRKVDAKIALLEVNGKVVKRGPLGARTIVVSLGGLPKGTFHIEVIMRGKRFSFEQSRAYHACGK
jgi:hypothetical protein